MAERNQLRMFELEVDGKVLASRMAFLLGDELYLHFSGYDLDWRKHGIMTTLMCECFKWAIERGIKIVNLAKGKDASKTRWRSRESAFHDALLMSPTRRGSLTYNLRKTKKRVVSVSEEIRLAVQRQRFFTSHLPPMAASTLINPVTLPLG